MANLTLTIDDDVLREARIRAVREGTSVNALVREQLTRYADASEAASEGLRRIVELAKGSASGSGPEGRTWTRDDLYER